jgi:hypothetical protein
LNDGEEEEDEELNEVTSTPRAIESEVIFVGLLLNCRTETPNLEALVVVGRERVTVGAGLPSKLSTAVSGAAIVSELRALSLEERTFVPKRTFAVLREIISSPTINED